MDKDQAQKLIKQVLPSFNISGTVGKGSFGAVYKIKDELKERVVKMVPLSASTGIENGNVVSADSKIERDFRHIVESYERIACDEIVPVYDFYMVRDEDSKDTGMAYALIIMEIYPSSLDKFVISHYEKTGRPMDMQVARKVILKVAVMVANLYTKTGFLFEDFKPDNILIKEHMGDLKLVVGDIGGLKNIVSIALTASQVTPSYCAPEIIRKAQVPDMRSIIYSYGLLSFFIIEGHLPYEDQNFNARFDLVRDKGLPFSRTDIPVDLKQVIENCVSFEAEQRCETFDEVVQWLKGTPPARANSAFSDGTITVNGKSAPAPPSSPVSQDFSDGTIVVGGGTAAPAPHAEAPANKVMELKSPKALSRPGLRSSRISALKARKKAGAPSTPEDSREVEKEIKGFVVRKGDSFKINNQACKVMGNIVVESNAVLSISNSRLYFAEHAGIIVLGALRSKDTLLSAIDNSKRWSNVTIYFTASSGTSIMENTRIQFGGGLSGKVLKGKFNITRPAIVDSSSYGGAMFIAGGGEKSLRMNNVTFFKSTAGEGGGLYLHRSKVNVDGCIFEGCTARGAGGGAYAYESTGTIGKSTFTKCSAAKDGGGVSFVASRSEIQESHFLGCMCKFNGGGLACIASNATIKNCRFERCTAMKTGGGVYADAKSKAEVLFPSFVNCKPNDSNINA